MKTTWVLVADEAIARILEWPRTGGELVPVEELTDPAAHESDVEQSRDALGRRASGASPGGGEGGAQGMRGVSNSVASAGQPPQHLQAESFARQVAQHLGECLQQKRFDELRIAAAPRFLGLLRKALSPQVAATVTDEQNKDLIHESNSAITTRMFSRPGV
jgi:protein required for attachment to host cells